MARRGPKVNEFLSGPQTSVLRAINSSPGSTMRVLREKYPQLPDYKTCSNAALQLTRLKVVSSRVVPIEFANANPLAYTINPLGTIALGLADRLNKARRDYEESKVDQENRKPLSPKDANLVRDLNKGLDRE